MEYVMEDCKLHLKTEYEHLLISNEFKGDIILIKDLVSYKSFKHFKDMFYRDKCITLQTQQIVVLEKNTVEYVQMYIDFMEARRVAFISSKMKYSNEAAHYNLYKNAYIHAIANYLSLDL